MPILAEVREVQAGSAEGIFKEIPRKARPASPEVNGGLGEVVFKSIQGRTLATAKQKGNGFGWEGKVFHLPESSGRKSTILHKIKS